VTTSAVIRQNQGYLSTLPLGVILAWHRDFAGGNGFEPALPPGWVPCNGQTLDDPESPFDGLAVPNLNGNTEAKQGGLFLRGASTSGVLQQDQMQSHNHAERTPHQHQIQLGNNTGAGPDVWVQHADPVGGDWGKYTTLPGTPLELGDPANSGTGGAPRHGRETRPANMSVLWIMKVKQVVAASALPAVLAEPRAPHGAIFVGADGHVGIGTSAPTAALHVAGDLNVTGDLIAKNVQDALSALQDAVAKLAAQAGAPVLVENGMQQISNASLSDGKPYRAQIKLTEKFRAAPAVHVALSALQPWSAGALVEATATSISPQGFVLQVAAASGAATVSASVSWLAIGA
jgi:H-type lectin domain